MEKENSMEHLRIVLIGIGISVGIVFWSISAFWLIGKIVEKLNKRSKARFMKKIEEEYNDKKE